VCPLYPSTCQRNEDWIIILCDAGIREWVWQHQRPLIGVARETVDGISVLLGGIAEGVSTALPFQSLESSCIRLVFHRIEDVESPLLIVRLPSAFQGGRCGVTLLLFSCGVQTLIGTKHIETGIYSDVGARIGAAFLNQFRTKLLGGAVNVRKFRSAFSTKPLTFSPSFHSFEARGLR
jgi:hypothetical protein